MHVLEVNISFNSNQLQGNDEFKHDARKRKNSGQIFRLPAPGAPTTDPDSTREQQGISGSAFCLKSVPGTHEKMLRDTPDEKRDILTQP
ncbi:hypothetical protein [Photobacterium halotolerans]|uniref:Uncharacterized protein n=1 Tax=Photobacterium halotolerans TaxID=265726 RepID=A0A0F5VE69_9GAMM|nr:hypothetical protein [Photobacterium halotolerans]KKD00471.1 hypothetical protein KY46_07485 [Photobacterium halotolerans]